MLLQPFEKLGNMECFYCRSPIQVYEFESAVYDYSKEGIPRACTNISHRLQGRCPKCGTFYDIGRIGLTSYIDGVTNNINMKGIEYYGKQTIQKDISSPDINEFCYDTGSVRE